jgi:hypothetical protein
MRSVEQALMQIKSAAAKRLTAPTRTTSDCPSFAFLNAFIIARPSFTTTLARHCQVLDNVAIGFDRSQCTYSRMAGMEAAPSVYPRGTTGKVTRRDRPSGQKRRRISVSFGILLQANAGIPLRNCCSNVSQRRQYRCITILATTKNERRTTNDEERTMNCVPQVCGLHGVLYLDPNDPTHAAKPPGSP